MDHYYYEDEEEYWEAVDETAGDSLSAFLSFVLAIIFLGSVFFLVFFWGLSVLSLPTEGLASTKIEQDTKHPSLAPLFTPEVHFWGDEIIAWAAHRGLDPNLVATVMQIESCGDPYAVSRAGEMGLFQVMPYHFEQGENPYSVETNALRGLAYLKKSLDSASGDYRLAFAGYNGGIGVIPKAEAAWAAETVRYVYWGSGIYADALRGNSSSARLDEWLEYGGASLCAQARSRQ